MLQSIKHIHQAIIFVWQSSPKLTISQIVILILLSVLPLVNLFLIKELVDEITFQANQTDFSYQQVIYFIVLMGIVMLLINLLTILSQYVSTGLQEKVKDYMSTIIQEKSVEIDLQFYEDPTYHDTLHRAHGSQRQLDQHPNSPLPIGSYQPSCREREVQLRPPLTYVIVQPTPESGDAGDEIPWLGSPELQSDRL